MEARGTGVIGLRILVVESDGAIRELLIEFLRGLGQEATPVGNLRNALALLERAQFDLMLVAHSLSEFSSLGLVANSLSSEGAGLALAKIAREDDPSLKIILLSGFAREGLNAVGANGFVDMTISKPFSLADVEDALAVLYVRI